jgi:hypothetical protein
MNKSTETATNEAATTAQWAPHAGPGSIAADILGGPVRSATLAGFLVSPAGSVTAPAGAWRVVGAPDHGVVRIRRYFTGPSGDLCAEYRIGAAARRRLARTALRRDGTYARPSGVQRCRVADLAPHGAAWADYRPHMRDAEGEAFAMEARKTREAAAKSAGSVAPSDRGIVPAWTMPAEGDRLTAVIAHSVASHRPRPDSPEWQSTAQGWTFTGEVREVRGIVDAVIASVGE